MSDPRRDAEMKLEAFQSLLRHPGWVLYAEHLKALEAQSLGQMETAKNNEELAKHTYSYLLLRAVRSSPEQTAVVLARQLQATQKP